MMLGLHPDKRPNDANMNRARHDLEARRDLLLSLLAVEQGLPSPPAHQPLLLPPVDPSSVPGVSYSPPSPPPPEQNLPSVRQPSVTFLSHLTGPDSFANPAPPPPESKSALIPSYKRIFMEYLSFVCNLSIAFLLGWFGLR
jgi:hypothetical protein